MGSAVAELALGSPAEGGPVRSLPWPGTTEGVIETRPSAHRVGPLMTQASSPEAVFFTAGVTR